MADRYNFTEQEKEELREIFHQEIVPMVFGGLEPFPQGQKPVLVQLIGQLAAGKSTALGDILERYPGRMAEVTPDRYRAFHPNYTQVMRERPHEMVEQTNDAMYFWSDMVRDYAHAQGYGLVVEGTGRNPDDLRAYAQYMAEPVDSRHSGFWNETWAVATPDMVSCNDMVGRYLSSPLGQGRWNDAQAHDQMFAQLPHTVAVMEQDPSVSRVVVTDRDGRTHYDNTRGPDGNWVQEPRGSQALREARLEGQVPLDQPQSRTWLTSYWSHNRAVIERGELNKRTAPTMRRLHEHADRIAPVAYSGQDERLHEHSQHQTVQGAVLLAGERGVPNSKLPATPTEFLTASPDQQRAYLTTMQQADPTSAVPDDAADAVRRTQQGQAPPGVQRTRPDSARPAGPMNEDRGSDLGR